MVRPADAGKRAQSDPSAHVSLTVRAPAASRARRTGPRTVSARLAAHVTLEARPDGHISLISTAIRSTSDGSVPLRQSACWGCKKASGSAHWRSGGRSTNGDRSLLRRLARRGLLEYPVGTIARRGHGRYRAAGCRYRPQTPPLGNGDVLALSRFAYLRRRGDAMVLESPRAEALFRICDPKIAAVLTTLSTPQQVGRLRRQDGFPGTEILALLVDCQILFKVDADHDSDLRRVEGNAELVLWDFHDLLFHARSTPGRHANPLGGAYSYADLAPAPPAVRRRWPGKAIDLRAHGPRLRTFRQPLRLLRERHSIRSYDDRRPITLAELAQFLDGTARVLSTWESRIDLGESGRWSPCDEALSIGRCKLRARALSCRAQMRRTDARVLSLRRRRACADADRGTLPQLEALFLKRSFNGCARHAANRHHHRGALRQGIMEIQLARLCADPEGCRRVDSDALSDGDRHGTGRMRDREQQYRPVRQNDRD